MRKKLLVHHRTCAMVKKLNVGFSRNTALTHWEHLSLVMGLNYGAIKSLSLHGKTLKMSKSTFLWGFFKSRDKSHTCFYFMRPKSLAIDIITMEIVIENMLKVKKSGTSRWLLSMASEASKMGGMTFASWSVIKFFLEWCFWQCHCHNLGHMWRPMLLSLYYACCNKQQNHLLIKTTLVVWQNIVYQTIITNSYKETPNHDTRHMKNQSIHLGESNQNSHLGESNQNSHLGESNQSVHLRAKNQSEARSTNHDIKHMKNYI